MSFRITPLGNHTPPEMEKPHVHDSSYKHSIVDSSYQPERSLLTMVEGSPRRFDYYRQFLGRDEEPRSFGPNDSPVHGSYTKIEGVIIKQEGDGSYNFNVDTGGNDKTYNGWVIFDLTPIKGDVLIADIGDGRAGLFNITEQPEIRNFTSNKVYYITYQLVTILSEDVFNKLENRVVETYVYSQDSQLHGGASVVTTGEFELGKKLSQWRMTITNHIMRNFYWNAERTIAYEDSGGQKVYDQYLVNFLAAMIDKDLRTTYPVINQFSTEYGGREFGTYGDINVWEVLLRGDFNLLSQCNHQVAMIDVSRVMGTRLYGNIRSSKFRWFIATDPKRYQQVRYPRDPEGHLTPNPVQPNDLMIDYLFTEGFYSGSPGNDLESLVLTGLRDKALQKKELLNYCEKYFDLTPKEQLYHGAILLLLLKLSRSLSRN